MLCGARRHLAFKNLAWRQGYEASTCRDATRTTPMMTVA